MDISIISYISFLNLPQAREFGDYVLGILGDDLTNRHRGANYPIVNLNERVLSVMQGVSVCVFAF